MRKPLLVTGSIILGVSFIPFQVSADVLGVGASLSYWDSDLSGEAARDGSVVDIENDLDLTSDSNVNLSGYIEHPVPVLPNIRLNLTRLSLEGRGNLSLGSFDGIPLNADVRSDFDLEQLDVTLYYEVLDNWINLDLGLTGRRLDGELVVQEIGGNQQVSETEVDAVLPMGYVAARFDLPLTGVSVGAEGNAISFDGDSVYDINAYGQYQLSALQVRAGYRRSAIDYEDGEDLLDVEISGPFISAGVLF
jgi:outer membrane protein